VRLSDCQDVESAADLQTLESRLVEFANDLGFGIICGVFVSESARCEPSIHYLGNTAAAFQSLSRNSPLRKRDPVMRRLKQSSAPLIYDQSTYVENNACDLWELQAQYGYKTGVAMSLHLPKRQHFIPASTASSRCLARRSCSRG